MRVRRKDEGGRRAREVDARSVKRRTRRRKLQTKMKQKRNEERTHIDPLSLASRLPRLEPRIRPPFCAISWTIFETIESVDIWLRPACAAAPPPSSCCGDVAGDRRRCCCWSCCLKAPGGDGGDCCPRCPRRRRCGGCAGAGASTAAWTEARASGCCAGAPTRWPRRALGAVAAPSPRAPPNPGTLVSTPNDDESQEL